jgi:hypothetical protein
VADDEIRGRNEVAPGWQRHPTEFSTHCGWAADHTAAHAELSVRAACRTRSAAWNSLVARDASGIGRPPACRRTMSARADDVIDGITRSLVSAGRPVRNMRRCCGFGPAIFAATFGAIVLKMGVGEFADQLTSISTISPSAGCRASMRSGSSRAIEELRGHHAPSMSLPLSAFSETRTGLAVRRDLCMGFPSLKPRRRLFRAMQLRHDRSIFDVTPLARMNPH